MARKDTFQTLEEGILLLQQGVRGFESISIETILQILSNKGRPLLLIFLSLPFCQPIQIPGFSIPFGLVIALIGLRMVFGKGIWLPRRLLLKKIGSHALGKMTDKALVIIRKIKPWIHPRLSWICHSAVMEKVNACMVFILGIFLALPLPIPLSNLAAAWSLFLIALGMLEDDGVFVLLGYLISLLTAGFFVIAAMELKKAI